MQQFSVCSLKTWGLCYQAGFGVSWVTSGSHLGLQDYDGLSVSIENYLHRNPCWSAYLVGRRITRYKSTTQAILWGKWHHRLKMTPIELRADESGSCLFFKLPDAPPLSTSKQRVRSKEYTDQTIVRHVPTRWGSEFMSYYIKNEIF